MNDSPLVALDWWVIGAYLVIALGAGLLVSRRSGGSIENFFLSGRNLPWWLAGTSMVATSFASDTPLVITHWTRAGGVALNWRWWSYVISTMLVVVLFSKLWQRSGVVTDVEFMELRYSGRPARALRGFKSIYQVVFLHCFVMGWVILGMTKVLMVIFDLDEAPVFSFGGVDITPAFLGMFGCATLALVYSEVAGLWGVVLTDFVQFVFALTGALVLMFIVADHFGGFGPLVDALRSDPTTASKLATSPATEGVELSSPSTWTPELWRHVVFLGVVWFATKNADGSGVTVQRLLASKNEKHATLAALWYAVAHYAVRPWPWIIVALASLLVLPSLDVASPVTGTVVEADGAQIVVAPLVEPASGAGAGAIADVAPGIVVPIPSTGEDGWAVLPLVAAGDDVVAGQIVASTDDERAYPAMMRRFLPAGLLGLLVASFLAAFMSTIDTHVNIACNYLVNDGYRRFLNPDAPEAHYVRVGRICGPVVLALALAFALSAESVRGMFDIFTALFAGVGIVYLLRWTWWRINAWSEIAALAAGAIVTWAVRLWPDLGTVLLPAALVEDGRPGLAGMILLVLGASILVFIPATLLTRPVDHDHLAAFYARVRPPGAWGPFAPPGSHGARELLPVVGTWLGALAFVLACLFLPGSLLLQEGRGAWVWAIVGLVGILVVRRSWRARQPVA